LTRDSNYTTGQIYQAVINKERRGEFLGKTVQVIPHITNEIKDCIHKLADEDVDVVITEIGGTVATSKASPSWKRFASSRSTWASGIASIST